MKYSLIQTGGRRRQSQLFQNTEFSNEEKDKKKAKQKVGAFFQTALTFQVAMLLLSYLSNQIL